MRNPKHSLLLALLVLAGCDWVAIARDVLPAPPQTTSAAGAPDARVARADAAAEPAQEAQGAAPAAKPAGWESLEDETSAARVYYQFVDERGSVRFVERLDEVPERWRATVGFVKMDVPPPLTPGDAARVRAAQTRTSGRAPIVVADVAPRRDVVLYSATWCGACRKAKRYLDDRGIDYEERDIDIPRHAEALVRLTGRRAVPVLDVGGRVLTGFSARNYAALIDRA